LRIDGVANDEEEQQNDAIARFIFFRNDQSASDWRNYIANFM
jgi:hypothetical protein